MLRALFYITLLAALLAAAFFLPKLVQSSEKFQPLAENMAKEVIPPAPPPTAPPPAEPAPAPAAAPETALPRPAADLSPFVTALASGDLAKAGTVLEVLRPRLNAAEFAELNRSLELSRTREAAKVSSEAKPGKAPDETQAMVLETLRQLQQSQQETTRLIAEIKSRKPEPAAQAAPSPPPAEMPSPAPSAPLPGMVVVRYGFDSSLLEEAESVKLKPIVQALAAEPKATVEIRGYADKSGKSTYNLGLSAARAQSVKDTLRRAGVEDQRIEIVSFGSFQAKDTSPDEAEDFRKVEVLLMR